MTRRLLFIIGVIGVLFFTLFFNGLLLPNAKAFLVKNRIIKNELEPVLALFNRTDTLKQVRKPSIVHYTMQIAGDRWPISDDFLKGIPDSTALLLTIEFWESKVMPNLFSRIWPKKKPKHFDENLRELCEKILNKRKQVYIRPNPEMEVPVKLFPWHRQYTKNRETFIYISNYLKKHAEHVQMVWGPAGFPGVLEVYPGNNAVAAISITLKSRSESIMDDYPPYPTIDDELHRKLHRLRFLNKPILILGSENTANQDFSMFDLIQVVESQNTYDSLIYSTANYRHGNMQPKLNGSKVQVGVFDPRLQLVHASFISTEHLFTDFGNIQSGLFQKMFKDVIGRNHDVLVTVEPWKDLRGVPDSNVLRGILAGNYDGTFDTLYTVIGETEQRVYLRFAHEMEIPVDRYAWQNKDPIDYILAFRYFMNYPKESMDHVKRIWGPAGDRGSLEFWPGVDVVDYLSIAIYGLPDKNITNPKQQLRFSTIFRDKYRRLYLVDKPIFISEFGVKGPEELQDEWLEDAALTINQYHQIIGVNYFNRTDVPKAWGDIKPPDWSITNQSFQQFIESLDREVL